MSEDFEGKLKKSQVASFFYIIATRMNTTNISGHMIINTNNELKIVLDIRC